MRRSFFISIITFSILTGTIAFFWHLKGSNGGFENRLFSQKGGEREEKRPNDWFFRQRAFPTGEIPMDQRVASIAQARALQVTAMSAGSWIEAGPINIPGRIADLAVHPNDLSTIYAGAAAGGVFKSTDGGNTWTPIFDDQGSPSIGALAIHPTDSNILYVGTGESNSSGDSYPGTGVYKTTDGGSTWAHIGLDPTRHIGRIVIDPVSPDKVYVAALGTLFGTNPDRGVYKTTDAGTTWSQVLFVSDSTGAVDIAINPSNPDILYAAMWERIRSPERRKVGGVSSGIYKTTNGGISWTLLTNGLPPSAPDVGRIGLAVAASSPNIVYAIYADHPGYFIGVYKTINNGLTWNQVNDAALTWLYSSFGWYFGNIRVDPTDPDKVFVMGVPLYLSTNGGNSWTEIANSVHVDHHTMVIPVSDPSRVYLGNDGGVYLSTNGGGTWTQSLDMPSTQFYAINIDRNNPQRLYGGTQDNGTMRTLTGALDDWERIFGGDGFYCNIDYNNSNILYAEYQWGNLYKSVNNGNNWSEAMNGIGGSDRTNWNTPVVMDPIRPNILYYGSYRLYRTIDGAGWWNAISTDLTDGPGPGNLTYGTITTIAPAASDSQVVYVGTDDANVWVTQDLGTSWTDISAGLPNRWVTRVAVNPIDPAIAYVTQSGYKSDSYLPHIHRTETFGITWQDISGNLPQAPISDVIIDPLLDSTLYVGTDVGVYVTYDLGQIWSPLGTGLNIPVIHDLALHQGTRSLVAGTHGRSMFRFDLTFRDVGVSSLGLQDTVFTDSTYTVMANVGNYGSTSETFDVIATINGYTDTVQVSLTPTEITFVFFAPWQVPSTDSTLYTVTVCTDLAGDMDTTNDCQSKTVFAYNPVGIEEESNEYRTPNFEFRLLNNHPNPFSRSTMIRYQIPLKIHESRISNHVSLNVYDINGRIVENLVEQVQEPGIYQVEWEAKDIPSGIYYYKLKVGNFSATKKLTLIH